MKQRTTIQIERDTLKRLSKTKIYPRETYDETINRLIEIATKIDGAKK